MKTILVAGGAGYIGSHMLTALAKKGYDAVVVDNLSTGHRHAITHGVLCVGDIRDATFLDTVFHKFNISGVINFAAYSQVGESVKDPLKYYMNNIQGTASLTAAMHRHGVKNMVFSSTAAVYGEPVSLPIRETDPTIPTNPYGETKLAVEKMLNWCDKAYGMRHVCLRYFNAAGASTTKLIGEDHHPETHLIPLVVKAGMGRRSKISIFGDDYPTADGTCVRDYIHVDDLCSAHLLALEYLEKGGESDVFNLGNGSGFSVKEIIAAAKNVAKRPITVEIAPRREGDPSTLVASNEKARTVLGWEPQYTDIEQIIATAWRWHTACPEGY